MITVDFEARLRQGYREPVPDPGRGVRLRPSRVRRLQMQRRSGHRGRHPVRGCRPRPDRLRLIEQLGEGGGGQSGAWRTSDLPFEDGVFDLVICSEVLEHVVHHRSAVSEVVRVLKRGGHLVVSVPRYVRSASVGRSPTTITTPTAAAMRFTANGRSPACWRPGNGLGLPLCAHACTPLTGGSSVWWARSARIRTA